MKSNKLESNWHVLNRRMLQLLSILTVCTEQWRLVTHMSRFDINVSLAKFVTLKFPSFTKVHIYTSIGELSSEFDEFLAKRSQFDSDHGVDFYVTTCCQSATCVTAFCVSLSFVFMEKNNK